ncbi:MAG: hypothetical protein ACRBB3_05175 [Alphaproteobacteria bacterium]
MSYTKKEDVSGMVFYQFFLIRPIRNTAHTSVCNELQGFGYWALGVRDAG